MEQYEIVLKGWIGELCRDWIPNSDVRHLADGTTELCGSLPDQTALHGVIGRARDLGIPLVRVERKDAMATPTSGGKGAQKPVTTPNKGGDKKPASGKKTR